MFERPLSRLAASAFLTAALTLGAATAAVADSTVTISQGVDPVTMDPLKRTITPTQNVSLNMFDTLLRHDREGRLVPWLATSWKQVAPTVWEFHLRRGVRFWNGDPLTSADVKFSVEKIKDPAEGSEQAPRVNTIARVETPDPYTVRYVTFKPTATIPGYPWVVSIVDAKYWRAHGNDYQAEHPMGSGPYVFRSWRKDDELDLDANRGWWHGKPPIDHAIFRPIPEAASRVAALRTGETDLITNVPPQYEAQLRGGRTTKIESARSVRVLFVAFNTLAPGPQRNPLVRRAFNYAVDVPALIATVLGGHAFRTATPVPPNFTGFSSKIPFYQHDLDKAKALLARAGYPNGKGLELVLNAPVGRYNRDKELAEAIAGQLSATGAKVTTRTMEWTSYVNETSRRALAPLYMLGWGDNSYDADNTLTSLFESSARLSTYANPAYDKLVDAARYETDPGKRQALYDRALTILHDDAPWIFLFQYEDLYGTSQRLHWRARADEGLAVDEMSLAN
jgi:peptide/nickel transport system substrate-binding protein